VDQLFSLPTATCTPNRRETTQSSLAKNAVCLALSWLQFPHSLALFEIKAKRALVGRDKFVTVKELHADMFVCQSILT
jgi:hypothetical protein